MHPSLRVTEATANEYKHLGSIPLRSTRTGTIVASLKDARHKPNPKDHPRPRRHKNVACEDVSIDVENIKPVLRGERGW